MSTSTVEPHQLVEAAAQAFSAASGIDTCVNAPPPIRTTMALSILLVRHHSPAE
jgi:hypothetical protein